MEPIEKVFPEGSLAQHFFQVAVSRGDKAGIHLGQFPPAEAPVLAFLEHAKQLGLQMQRKVSNLVQEQGSFRSCLEEAHTAAGGARKSSFFVAKQFAFQKILGQGGAVERHKRALTATAG